MLFPPEHNLSEENSFRTWLEEFQGTMGLLEGRKTYSIIPHTTTTTTFALHMLTPEAGVTINNQPICPIYFCNRVKFYHTGHVLFWRSLASQLFHNSLSSTTYTWSCILNKTAVLLCPNKTACRQSTTLWSLCNRFKYLNLMHHFQKFGDLTCCLFDYTHNPDYKGSAKICFGN